VGIASLAIALLAVPVATASPADGVCVGPQSAFDPPAEHTLRSMTNAFRRDNGRRPLRAQGRLTRNARRYSFTMARTGYFGHAVGGKRFSWSRRRPAGETLALAATPAGVMEVLIGSATHRAILLDPAFRVFGIGVLRTCTGYLLVTEYFTG